MPDLTSSLVLNDPPAWPEYQRALAKALAAIKQHGAQMLIVSLGRGFMEKQHSTDEPNTCVCMGIHPGYQSFRHI